ncbi:dual specificity protein kinase pyk3-like isoform X2 [Drosophila nasuta]|uniref:dual specificity protein kinase pyk3-like isoform X2 n=1 Tax=Drosophila nasuta TaxID=42062 RepID=UPI00295F0A68|nr:dual specificity protein kinase pyk3-like isoform X2 [Drosophila nasuta]
MDKIVTSVSSNEIQIRERIGYGSYGVVHKALWQTELEVITIAVKIIEDKSQDSETEKIRFEKNILREIENLQKCTHPNIITLYGVSKYSDNICLLFEYADCGSLYKFLHRTKREVSMDERIDWMLQCAKGIEYLHKKSIVHRDLKTQNLLLFNGYRTLKICDFGTVKELVTINTEVIGTVCYMAPEVCNFNGKYTEKCDVFSFAIIFWEVMSRKKPFYEFNNLHALAIQKKIIEDKRPNLNDIIYKNCDWVKPIIKKCWDHDPKKRATMKELSDFLPNYDIYIFFNEIQFRRGMQLRGITDFCTAIWKNKKIVVHKIKDYFEEDEKSFFKEIRNLKRLNHSNIITLYGASKYPDNRLCVLSEFADCDSLYDCIHDDDFKISYYQILRWMLQCAKALKYLHTKKIVHRSLSSRNLLLFDKYRVLKISNIYQVKKFRSVPDPYLAPEYWDTNGKFTEKGNIFSFAIIFLEVMTRKKPFELYRLMEIFSVAHNLKNDLIHMEINESDTIMQIIKKCLNRNPENRPTMKRIVSFLGCDYRFRINVDHADLGFTTFTDSTCETLCTALWRRSESNGLVKHDFDTDLITTKVALKEIDCNKKMIWEIMREVPKILGLAHENIATLYGVSLNYLNKICMVVEYAKCRTLYHLLHCRKYKRILFREKLNWIQQCAKGLEYLHGKNIIHRGLTTRSLLLFDNCRKLKIADFGKMNEVEKIRTDLMCCYLAPEVCMGKKNYSEKSDVFSFGIIFWEVIQREKPFSDWDLHDISEHIKRGIRPDIYNLINDDYSGIVPIMECCWRQSSTDRPTMSEVRRDLNYSIKRYDHQSNCCIS